MLHPEQAEHLAPVEDSRRSADSDAKHEANGIAKTVFSKHGLVFVRSREGVEDAQDDRTGDQ